MVSEKHQQYKRDFFSQTAFSSNHSSLSPSQEHLPSSFPQENTATEVNKKS